MMRCGLLCAGSLKAAVLQGIEADATWIWKVRNGLEVKLDTLSVRVFGERSLSR
jgi:hypothetical protein